MNSSIKMVMCAMFLIVLNSSVWPQSDNSKTSNASQSEKVYKASEVTKRPKVTFKPDAEYTSQAQQNNVTGTVFLWVVFRSSGEVTNIRPRSGLPFGLTERAMAAARKIKFEPGEKEGQRVSVLMIVEYEFRSPKR